MSWNDRSRALLLTIIVFTFLSVLLVWPATIVGAEQEPNDSFDRAETLTEGSTTGTISSGDIDDYYMVAIAAGQTLTVDFGVGSTTTNPLYCYLYNGTQDQQAVQRVLSQSSYTIEHTVSDETAGNWYLRVSGAWKYGTYENSYSLNVQLNNQNDAEQATDAGDTIEDALEIETDRSISGFLGDDDRIDYYSFRVQENGKYNLSFETKTSGDAELYFYIYTSDEIPMGLVKVSPGLSSGYSIPEKHTKFADYYVAVALVSGSTSDSNTYTVKISETLSDTGEETFLDQLGVWTLTSPGIYIILAAVIAITAIVLFLKLKKGREAQALGSTKRALSVKALVIGIVIIVVFSILSWALPTYLDIGPAGAVAYEVPPRTNLPPTAVITINTTTVRVDENVTFSADGSFDPDGEVTSYAWSFSDGGTAQNVTTVHSFSSANTYTITLTVKDELGMQGTTTMNLSVLANNTNIERQSILLSALEPVGFASETIAFTVSPNAMYCEVNFTISGRGTTGNDQPPIMVNHSVLETEFRGANGEEINRSVYEVAWTESESDVYVLYTFESYGSYELELKCVRGAVVCQVNIDVYY